MLVTSIFSFSHGVSTLSKGGTAILATFNLSSASAFNLVMSIILSFGKGLKMSVILNNLTEIVGIL